MKTVDIALITWNRLELTKKCISSLLEYTDYPFHLSVVDNGSTDGTRDYLSDLFEKGMINRILFFDKNVGVSPASNSIWDLSSADYFLKIDNDIEFCRKGWLSEMIRIVDRNQEIGVLAFSFFAQLHDVLFPLGELSGGDIVQVPTGNLGGACILVPRRTSDKLGFWCEDYGQYGEEDTDYSFRVRLADQVPAYLRESDWIIMNSLPKDDNFDPMTYREFKDRQRDDNISRLGPFRINALMYALKQRELYMKRRFRTIVAEDGISASLALDHDYYAEVGKAGCGKD